jgi:hypothetical protein
MIRIIGPRDKPTPGAINTTSHSRSEWSSGLSPFNLGPVTLYQGITARIFENAWQFAKLYPEHADSNGDPTQTYWTWAHRGWNSAKPYRYPMGKGRKPLCSLWDGRRLNYIDARKNIYLPLYRDAVKNTNAFRILKRIYQETGSVTLFDFDGYDHHAVRMNLHEVLDNPNRICGHAFILAMMLTYGENFKPEDLLGAPVA